MGLKTLMCMYLPDPSTQAGCDTSLNFKQTLTGLKSE